MKRLSAAVLCLTFLAGCTPTPKQGDASAWQPFPTPGASALEEKPFGASVSYAETPVTIRTFPSALRVIVPENAPEKLFRPIGEPG